MNAKNNLPNNDKPTIEEEKNDSKIEENKILQNEKKDEIPEPKNNQENITDQNNIKKNEEFVDKEELRNDENENNFNNQNKDKKEENPQIINEEQKKNEIANNMGEENPPKPNIEQLKNESENNNLQKEKNNPIDENKNEIVSKEIKKDNVNEADIPENNLEEKNKEIENEDNIPEKNIVEKNKEVEKDKLKEEINQGKNQEKEKINQENNKNENINSVENLNDNNNIQIINPVEQKQEQDSNENLNINNELKKNIHIYGEANEEENQMVEELVRDLDPADIFNQNKQRENEEDNELAKKLSVVGNINEVEAKPKFDMRAFLEEGEKKKKLEEYSKNIDNLLDSITMDWLSGDKNSYITKYEYKYIGDMNELFNKINENESIKDEIICKIFKFICDYFFRRKDLLNEIPWVEINNLRKIIAKENFEGVCILKNDNLLIEQYQELILCYNIEKTEDNIIEYNNCNFFKYLIEFLFRIGFFESFLDKVYLRDDEIFYSQVDNEINFFLDDFIKLILYPSKIFSFCKKEYLVKNNYIEKFINKFLMKLENIIKSNDLKEEFKKQFYNTMTEKYRIIIGSMFNNNYFDENKDNKNSSWEKLTYYVLIIAENYLRQQKLESRVYGLNLISQMIEAFKDENNEPEYANKLLFVKKSIINYINKINIFSLIFEENIHEALVPRTYNLLSFLYKNKSFSKEQIKHLWMLSQDKYQTISDSIIELFGKLLPEFSMDDSNEILKIVSEMNLSDVNEVTLKLLENFFNSKERNENLYKILYKFSDELTLNEGLNKNIIIKSRTILVKLLFNQIYIKDLINIIKKCIFNIGKNYLINTSLSVLKLIIEEFHRNENLPDVRKILAEINPNIHSLELLIKFLDKKGSLFPVLFTSILDNAYLIQFLLEESKGLNQLINNNDNFDSELPKKLDDMYKRYIEPENGYYYNYGLNGHIQGINININPIRQISSNQLDKTQSTEKSLNEGLIGEEEDNDGNNQNIINNNEDIFSNEAGNWEFEINPEKYFKNIFKEFILFLKKIYSKNNFIIFSESDLIDCVFNQFEFPFNKKTHYQNIKDLLEIIISFFTMGKIQIHIGYFKYLYDFSINNSNINQEKIIYYKFLYEIVKKQEENPNILLISDKVLAELILDKSSKYDPSSINQLPFEAFEFFKVFLIYFNKKHGNISYSNTTKKILSIQRYDLLAGNHILENYFIYTKDDNIYNESLNLLTNILSIASEKITNRKQILDKIFDFLKNNLNKINKDKEVKTQIIREIKLISIINNTKVKDFYDENDTNSLIQINVVLKLNKLNGETENFTVNKNMKIKDLKNEIMNKIILSEKNVILYNQQMSLDRLSINFSAEEIRQEINKKGFNITYKNQDLDDNSSLNDYNIENDDFIQITEKEIKINNINEIQISEERLNEEYEKIKNIFSALSEDLIKLSIKKNNANTEETIMFLTEEKNIIDLQKEIDEKKKKEKVENKKKQKKEEENIIPFEEDKINLLFEILNQEDDLINDEIWKLLGSIKYPDNIINTAISEELMNVISEPNLYKMLLNIKLVNSLIFDDKFCKYNKISLDKKLNWTSNFIKNESFVNTILNKMNNIGEIKENNEINEIKEEGKNEPEIGENNVLKFQILSIFSNWLHNIFVNMADFIKNKYIQSILNDIKQCNSFTFQNQNNGNHNQNQIININSINNENDNNEQQKIQTINENDAKIFIKILNKYSIVELFYKIIKTSLILTKDYKNIIQLVLEMQMIYFSINKKSIKRFIEEEKNNKTFFYLLASDKNKDIRIMILNFFKIIVKNLNDYETKPKTKNINEIKEDDKKIININEINNEPNLTENNDKKEIKNEEKPAEIDHSKEENKEKEKDAENLNINNIKAKEKEIPNKDNEENNIENIPNEVLKEENEIKKEENENKNVSNDNQNKNKAIFYDINEIDNYAINQQNSKSDEKPDNKKQQIEQDNEEEEESSIEETKVKDNLLFKILINLYHDNVITEDLFNQEFYVLYSFLLNFKELLFDEEDKENFLISKQISFLIKNIHKLIILSGDEFIQKKYKIMYDIYLLSSCCKYYNSLVKYYLDKNLEIDLISLIYDSLFQMTKASNNITSYKFDWDNLRKHSYNLLSNIIFLDTKYINKWLPKILNYKPLISQKKLQINMDFKLRDPIHDKLIGLKNFGATCYLNSLFQQMFMNPIFSNDLLSFDFSTQIDIDLKSSVMYNMQLGFANLRYSCLGVYPPLEFIQSFKKAFNGQPIQFGVQQDSDEFLSILCDELEKEAKIFNKENFLNNSFKGIISNEIVSLNKEYPYYSKTDEDFYRITLDIKGHKTLQEALDAYIKGEILDGDNQYYVEKYKKKLPIRKSSSLKILGNQVIVHLKRFEFDFVTFTNKKLNDYLEFPFEINFKKWTRAYLRTSDPNLNPELLNITDKEKENLEEENMNYVLTGILIHSGSSLQSGHYYSLIIDQESGKWYQFNDNNITEFNIERDLEKECFGIKGKINGEQFGRTAYLLFYTKKSLYRNEKVLKGIKYNQNIVNEVHKENIRYLEIKTYSSNLYQDFLIKLANNCFKHCKDTNIEKEYSITNKYRKEIKLFEEVEKNQKKEEKKEQFEDINKIEGEEEQKISKNDLIIPDNIEEIFNKLKNEDIKDNSELKIKEYTNKKLVKSLLYYTFGIATRYFDSNAKIGSLMKTINNFISSKKIFGLSILKSMEKYIDVILDYIFICGAKSQDMQIISQEIFDLFKNIFENVYIYEKENLPIFVNKFNYISKNENTNQYEIKQEYESCLIRAVKNLFCKNLERCRKEYSKDLMFLHLFRFCSFTFPEISIILEDYLIPLISFITNNKLSETYLKSKENPTFYMGGNPNWKPNENYELIFSDIIIHSINDGMYQKKKLSPFFIKENKNYIINKKEEINENEMFEYYPKLPKNIFAILSPQFIYDFLNSKNCTTELLGNLCYENEQFSNFFFKKINTYLKDLNKNYGDFENIFIKICSLFKLDDSLNDQRLEKLFELGPDNNSNPTLFDYYNSVKDKNNFVLDFIYILTTVTLDNNIIFDYLYQNKNKIEWIYEYFKQIRMERSNNRAYNVVNSLHPEFIDIIEEGLINRLNFEEKIELVNDDNDDDTGFNLI